MFGSVAPLAPEPETERSRAAQPPEENVFAVSQEEGNNRTALAAAGVVVALILGLGFYLVSRPKSEPGPAPAPAAAATPAPAAQPPAPPPAAAAAAGKPVKFKVMTDPTGAQVFMGAKAMGETPVEFEVQADKPDGTVTIDLVLILDGYYPLPVTAGGSGVVLITQRMQKRAAGAGLGQGLAGGAKGLGPRKPGKRGPQDDQGFDGKIDAPELMVEAPPELVKAPELAKPAPPPVPVAAAAPPPAPVPAATPAAGGSPPAPVAAAAPPKGVVQFDGETMTRPQLIDKGKPLQYTQEALRARVEGLMIVRCVISTSGKPEGCRVIKPLPYMERAVLDALASRTYKPISQNGKVVAVDYVFEVKLKLPTEL
jgi:serine/threonine-protein kinase